MQRCLSIWNVHLKFLNKASSCSRYRYIQSRAWTYLDIVHGTYLDRALPSEGLQDGSWRLVPQSRRVGRWSGARRREGPMVARRRKGAGVARCRKGAGSHRHLIRRPAHLSARELLARMWSSSRAASWGGSGEMRWRRRQRLGMRWWRRCDRR